MAWLASTSKLEDAYKSLREALVHGGIAHGLKTRIDWVEAEHLEGTGDLSQLEKYDGILVPGGFGKRGIPGMIRAIRFARESKVPYFGICLGMQCAVLEFAQNVAGIEKANSTEFDIGTPQSGDLQAAGPAGCGYDRWDHEGWARIPAIFGGDAT